MGEWTDGTSVTEKEEWYCSDAVDPPAPGHLSSERQTHLYLGQVWLEYIRLQFAFLLQNETMCPCSEIILLAFNCGCVYFKALMGTSVVD